MGGAVAFQDALKARLDICKPSKTKVITAHPPQLRIPQLVLRATTEIGTSDMSRSSI